MSIPKILNIVWVGPHSPPQEAIDTWSNKHVNGWLFTLWTDHTKGWVNQAQIDARYARQEFNGVADCMRYEILFKHGGFCVDADSTCLKALDEGPEDFLASDTALACYENELVRPGMVGCGFLGAPKAHIFFDACIDEVSKQDPREAAWKTVGPILMTKIVKELPDDIRVLPARSFNPIHHSGVKAEGTGPIYSEQHWASTVGYNKMRKFSCSCHICRNTQSMLRPSWG